MDTVSKSKVNVGIGHDCSRLRVLVSSGGILHHHRRERFAVITGQLQAAEVLSKLSTVNDKLPFVKVPFVIIKHLGITKQLKLYFNNSSRIPTQETWYTNIEWLSGRTPART
jgi:hypothetical protein